jgi:hypothetical protein
VLYRVSDQLLEHVVQLTGNLDHGIPEHRLDLSVREPVRLADAVVNDSDADRRAEKTKLTEPVLALAEG